MNYSHDYSFVSASFNHNDPVRRPISARPFIIQDYPLLLSGCRPSAMPYDLPSTQALLSTLEYASRRPLLTQTLVYPSDFQATGGLLQPTVPSWRKTPSDGNSTAYASGAGPSHLSTSTAMLIPFAVPTPALDLPPVSPPRYHTPMLVYPSEEDDNIKMESPVLSLEDICHVDASSSEEPSFPPPLVAPSSPDMLAPPLARPSADDAAYSDCPSHDYLAPTWNPPSSVPSLSYESFSGSEGTLLASLSSQGVSPSHLLRRSVTPPPVVKQEAPSSPPMFGIIADVNMREYALKSRSPPICVKPADIMTDSLRVPSSRSMSSLSCETEREPEPINPFPTPGPSSATPVAPSLPAPSRRELSPPVDYTANFPDEALISTEFHKDAISAIVSVLKDSTSSQAASVHQQDLRVQDAALPPQSFPLESQGVVAPQPVYPSYGYVFPGNDLGTLQLDLAAATAGSIKAPVSRPLQNKRVPLADLPIPQPQYPPPAHTHYPSASYPVATYVFNSPGSSLLAFPPPAIETASAPTPASPVLNAHLGIPLEDLRRRAAQYRSLNEGADLDKAFLQSFAGKLSVHGELLDEYRCYVTGCEQRNKRRDHILVHVGSHVEHRPWACRHCGMRFLRNNECKRHESSHEGRKPYSCMICAPVQDRSFVRQDLLKRHMRVSHGVQDVNGRKKKAGAKNEDADYWP